MFTARPQSSCEGGGINPPRRQRCAVDFPSYCKSCVHWVFTMNEGLFLEF